MNFAVIKEDKVINVIVADSQEIAEEVTGLTCIPYVESDIVRIGLDYVDGEFKEPVTE